MGLYPNPDLSNKTESRVSVNEAVVQLLFVLYRVTRVRDANCAHDLRGGGRRQAAGLPVHLRLPESHIIRTRRPRYSRPLVQVEEYEKFHW